MDRSTPLSKEQNFNFFNAGREEGDKKSLSQLPSEFSFCKFLNDFFKYLKL